MKNFVYCFLSVALLFSVYYGETAAANNHDTKRMIVVFDETLSEQEINETVEEVDGEIKGIFDEITVATVEVPEDMINTLLEDPAVKSVEEDILIQLNAQIEDWGIQSTHIPLAWDSGFTGKGVKVAVIDSGISAHSDLTITGGISTVDYTTSYSDDQGHGTHVAGVIAARNNSIGVKGVAYESEIYAVKAFDQKGDAYLSDIIEGIDWSIANGMDIINLSAGSQTDSTALQLAIDQAYDSGIILVAAAGNDGSSDGLDDSVDYPARYSSVIGVGAVDRYLTRAGFSSTGPAVEVAAPGVKILSTYIGNQYAYMSGTSMATPYVTGKLALLKQAYPLLSNKELRNVLIEHTQDLGQVGRDVFYGYGYIQASSFTEPIVGVEENSITSLKLSANSISGVPGQVQDVTASAIYQNGTSENVTNQADWSSSNTAVAKVISGKVELMGYGTTSITSNYEGHSAVLTVSVPEPDPLPEPNSVVSLEVNQPTLHGKPGDIFIVTASATFQNGQVTNVTSQAKWSSVNMSVATVTAGKVELKGYGSTTITVTYESQSAMIVVNSPEPQPPPVAIDFKDVSSFYYPAVEFLARNHITRGISDTEFGVEKDIIRADAAIWLARELGLNMETAKASGFTDVPSRAVGAVNALKEAGIVGGKTSSRFGSYDSITRGEVAIILQRAYKLSANGQTSVFTDVSIRYKDAVNALVANKVASGITATKYGVAYPITRGQLAVFLYRLR